MGAFLPSSLPGITEGQVEFGKGGEAVAVPPEASPFTSIYY